MFYKWLTTISCRPSRRERYSMPCTCLFLQFQCQPSRLHVLLNLQHPWLIAGQSQGTLEQCQPCGHEDQEKGQQQIRHPTAKGEHSHPASFLIRRDPWNVACTNDDGQDTQPVHFLLSTEGLDVYPPYSSPGNFADTGQCVIFAHRFAGAWWRHSWCGGR